ncbi:MAG: thioredoxin [Bacteroidota bacterium]
MKNIVLSLVCVATFLFSSCKGQTNNINESIEPKVFAEKINSDDVYLIDVRTPQEYAAQHIGNAVNIDINGPDFDTQLENLDKKKPVYVYCLSGGRSAKAAQKMSDLGFTEVYNLSGGITKWNAEGFGKPANTGGMTLADFQKTINSDKKVLIDFYAEWCGPCKKMAPYLEKMKEEYKGKITIIKIDVDKNPQLAQQLQIEGLPTLKLFENGKEKWSNLGYISEEELKSKL